MQTVLTRSAAEAAQVIKKGGLAAFPTETVYGLGADAFNETALGNIFLTKGRPADNPLIVHIANLEQINLLTSAMTASAEKFIAAFFPGALTLVLPKSDKVSPLVTAGLDTVGIRMPGNKSAQEFLQLCATPVAAPSANLSGRPSPTTWQAVFEDLDGRIDCILQGEETEVGLESTVVDCTGEVPQILRSGAVTLEQLREVVPETKTAAGDSELVPKSPGLKHKHYSPRARVVLVDDISEAEIDPRCAYIGVGGAGDMASAEKIDGWGLAKICHSVTEYAHAVFEFFRECDRRGIETIYCQKVTAAGLGTALMDRLRRAAQS
ncbi:MAG TPA: L-threonylcarbamoyladenylate synthase [Pyrinomonadaceae bacterium]|jgi:L-threonylcarbamoyladenylate synthase|nr:L-threonylcarbamoyladenylate synthase [Pyrinomonadaceae bacterium]